MSSPAVQPAMQQEDERLSARVIGPLQSKQQQQQQQKRCSKGEIRVAQKPRATCVTYLCDRCCWRWETHIEYSTVQGLAITALASRILSSLWWDVHLCSTRTPRALNDVPNDASKLRSWFGTFDAQQTGSVCYSIWCNPFQITPSCAPYTELYCIVVSFWCV